MADDLAPGGYALDLPALSRRLPRHDGLGHAADSLYDTLDDLDHALADGADLADVAAFADQAQRLLDEVRWTAGVEVRGGGESVPRGAADLDGWMTALADELADSPNERHKRAAAALESLAQPKRGEQ